MRIFNVYRGVRGFVTLYHDALRYAYMITPKALKKARILAFWEKHGIAATLEAFEVKRSTLFLWKKQQKEGKGVIEALNERSTMPHNKRKRSWPILITSEIRRQRSLHPNLGKDKLHVLLAPFCTQHNLTVPSSSTIGRIIKDCGGLRMFPRKVRHNGKIVPFKRKRSYASRMTSRRHMRDIWWRWIPLSDLCTDCADTLSPLKISIQGLRLRGAPPAMRLKPQKSSLNTAGWCFRIPLYMC